MKIFIDSADLGEIKEAAATGFLEGCTTNPSLLAKAGRKIEEAIPEICEIVDGPVSAEVVSVEYEAILKAHLLARDAGGDDRRRLRDAANRRDAAVAQASADRRGARQVPRRRQERSLIFGGPPPELIA